MEYQEMLRLPKVYVRAYTFAEAELIMKVMMRAGFEGVQNDSYRYCDVCASAALDGGILYHQRLKHIFHEDQRTHQHPPDATESKRRPRRPFR